MHQFFFEHKLIAWILALIGLGCSCLLYYRAFDRLTQAQSKQPRRRRPRPGPTAGTPAPSTGQTPPAEDTGQGHQEDLLTRLAREEDGGSDTDLENPKEATTRSLAPQRDAKYRSTHILKRPGDDEADPTERSPARDAVRAAVEESFRAHSWGDDDQNDHASEPGHTSDTAVADDETGMPGSSPFSSANLPIPDEATEGEKPGHDSALTRRLAQEAAEAEQEATDEATTPAPRVRKSLTDTEVIRRARRIEEIGLHKEIQRTEVDQGSLRRISEQERQRRLAELGLDLDSSDAPAAAAAAAAAPSADTPGADTPSAEAPPAAPASGERLGTTQLNSILDRLDAALGDDEEDAGAAPAATPPPAPSAPPSSAAPLAEAPVPSEEPTPPRGDTAVTDHADDAPAEGTAEADDDDAAIPDWARADTFDDDDDTDAEGQQQKLF